jgi:hypothetical protein
MHSSPKDYPITAEKKGIKSNSEWEQTIVTYEAFRAPMFAPEHIKMRHDEGQFIKA